MFSVVSVVDIDIDIAGIARGGRGDTGVHVFRARAVG
jgi:hypothetical protein